MNYRCLIVDDERPALKLIAAYISKMPNLELIASCENGMQALAALQEHSIDILFLDIQMPDLTGLDLLKVLKEKPEVVLTTAYRDYAVEGFALDVTDYLVKPFSFERFIQAVHKCIDRLKLKNAEILPPSHSAQNEIKKENTTTDHFFVRTNQKMEKVKLDQILFLESMREYVCIHTNGHRYVIHQTMNRMEDELPTTQFMRVHRSYIIALKHINAINGNTAIINEKEIPIGGSYRKAFFEKVKSF